ncbi:DUF2631 domain-containing protein [Corynebacterium stercoris]|uniref:DUF2631 domain-containing protein n=1 Tax=Corynebacterium stercoris TaxID=2943490 RepID=UPI003F5A5565
MAHHAKKHEAQVYNGVSEADVPSARFGWSEFSRGTIQAAGWISVLFLVAFNFGNHQGHVETIWLISLAVLIALGLILHATQPKLSQVRTVTAHNKPVDHQEPDWAYDQKTLSGAYENLDERQLRALNIDPARITHLRPQREVVAAPAHTTERVEVVKVAPREKHVR